MCRDYKALESGKFFFSEQVNLSVMVASKLFKTSR